MVRREFMKSALGMAAAAGTGSAAVAVARQPAVPMSAAAFHRQRQFASTPFGRIAYVEAEAGPRAAIFLHRWPLNRFHWRGSLAALAPYCRCIAPDFMGLGYSQIAAGQALSPTRQTDRGVHGSGGCGEGRHRR